MFVLILIDLFFLVIMEFDSTLIIFWLSKSDFPIQLKYIKTIWKKNNHKVLFCFDIKEIKNSTPFERYRPKKRQVQNEDCEDASKHSNLWFSIQLSICIPVLIDFQ